MKWLMHHVIKGTFLVFNHLNRLILDLVRLCLDECKIHDQGKPHQMQCVRSLFRWLKSRNAPINAYWSYHEFCMADLNGMQKWLSVGDHIMVNVYNYFDRYSYMLMYEYSIGFFYQIWWSRFETQINTPTKTSVYINKEGRFYTVVHPNLQFTPANAII